MQEKEIKIVEAYQIYSLVAHGEIKKLGEICRRALEKWPVEMQDIIENVVDRDRRDINLGEEKI